MIKAWFSSLFDVVFSDLNGLHVQRDELVGTFRQAVAQTVHELFNDAGGGMLEFIP